MLGKGRVRFSARCDQPSSMAADRERLRGLFILSRGSAPLAGSARCSGLRERSVSFVLPSPSPSQLSIDRRLLKG